MAQTIDRATFENILRSMLGTQFTRATTVFENYGPALGFDVVNVLIHAADQGKVEAVLDALERHYKQHLKFQHPEIRGQVASMGTNLTEQMFLRLCTETLGLQPTA